MYQGALKVTACNLQGGTSPDSRIETLDLRESFKILPKCNIGRNIGEMIFKVIYLDPAE